MSSVSVVVPAEPSAFALRTAVPLTVTSRPVSATPPRSSAPAPTVKLDEAFWRPSPSKATFPETVVVPV